jgi:Tfp pilus tip-associated adhesin PilY1
MEVKNLRREAVLRAGYEDKLRAAETKRINAIRKVDVGNVNMAAQTQAAAAATLATSVTASAEAMRTTVAATASAAQTALTAALGPIIKDVSELRQAMYQQQGERAQASDARDDPMLQQVQLLRRELDRQQGGQMQRTDNRGVNQWQITTIIAVVTLIIFAVVALSGHLR